LEEITEATYQKFKEKKLRLMTNNNGAALYTTRKIRGWLDCVMIKSANLTDIEIEIEEDYSVMKQLQIQGTKIYFPRAQGKAVGSNQYMSFSTARYSLNSPVVISIISNPNTEVVVTLRWI